MKKLMWIIAGISLVGTAAAVKFMPEQIPMHYNAAGEIDRWGSRFEAFIFPAAVIVMALVFTLIIAAALKKANTAADEKERAGARANAKVLGIAGAAVAALLTVMEGFVLCDACKNAASGAERGAVDTLMIACILMGAVFIVLGNFMPKTRKNSTVGVRTTWSMYNDNTWRESNRFGGYALIAAGVLTVIEAIFIKSSLARVIVMLVLLAAAVTATMIRAHKVYTEEKAKESRQ